jgi:hypothetical protein
VKTAIAIIGLCVAITGHGLAQTNRVSTNATIKAAAQKPKPFVMPDEITTLSGKTYEGVKLQSATANEIYITYIDNESVMQADNIKLANLPPDLQKHFKYDQKKAALADAKEKEEEAKLVSNGGMTPSQARIYYYNNTLERRQDEADAAAAAAAEKEKEEEELNERQVEAREQAAQAPMIQAQKPPDQVNVIQVQQQQQQ